MNGSVVRKVCEVVGALEVLITVGVDGLLHWSDIRTTVTTSAATNTTPITPATETTAELRYHAFRSGSGSGFEFGATGADTSERTRAGNLMGGTHGRGP
jgi:hypothetical protein